MKKNILLLVTLYFSLSFGEGWGEAAFAQFTNLNWKVGEKCSIDFKSGIGIPVITDSCKSQMQFTNASICDKSGNIIFFSNACRVYDRNGNVMPNGSGFNQGTYSNNYVNTDYYPSWKAATIIPFPNDSNKFYMFYLNLEYNLDGTYIPSKLYYLVVDRTLNGGLGDVVVKDQIAINGDTLNKDIVFAIQHGNGRDWWVILRKYKSNLYYKVLVDSTGLHTTTPQIIGNKFNYPNPYGFVGNVSLEGNKICFLHSATTYQPFQMDLFDFDRCTGMLGNYQTIFHANVTDTISWWSSCFSPNGRYLYVNDKLKIYQMDLHSATLLNSATVVGLNTIKYRAFFKMEIAPDNKIYVAPYGGYEYMSVINKPDSFGLSCNFVENAIQFGSHVNGPWVEGGLPNVPNFALGKIDCGVGIEEQSANTKNELVIYPNPCNEELLVMSDKLLVNTIEVTNLLGQKISFDRLRMTGHGELVEPYKLNTYNLPSGIYFIKVTDEQGNIKTGKFVKE